MDKQELERRLEAAEKQNLGLLDEIKNLKAQLAEMQDEPEIPDKPEFEMDEKFYYLDSVTDDVEDSCHVGDIDAIDFNMFHTKEMAQEFAKKCKLIAMMLHCKWYLDRDFVPDWSDKLKHKWQLYYDHDDKKMVAGNYSHSDYSVVFSTEENARKCADWLNKHWSKNDEESV
jgi:hypothetical protein